MGQGILEFLEFRHCEALKKEGAISSRIPSKIPSLRNSVLFNLKKKGILELKILEFPSSLS